MSLTSNGAAALAPDVLAEIDLTIEHFNANHPDTVLLLARFAAGCEDATDAEALTVDANGVDIAVRVGGLASMARLEFEQPVGTAAEVSANVVAQIGVARSRAGDRMAETSMEHESALVGTLRTYITHVAEIRDLSPNLREIVLEGGFDDFRSVGGDQFVYLFVRRDGGPEVPVDLSMATWRSDDVETRPLGAYYTVRAWDPDRQRITLWVVRHGHAAGVGGWADRCEVGERVAIWGPRPSFVTPDAATSHLFVADESGFAAVAARIGEIPDGHTIWILAETIDADHQITFDERAHVTWLHRGDDAPGTGRRLLDAVRELDLGDLDVVAAFGAAESHEITSIRKYLRRELGMRADHVSMTGYWRR